MIRIGIWIKRKIKATIELLTGRISTEDGFSILQEDGVNGFKTEED